MRALWLAAIFSIGGLVGTMANAALPARMADCTVDLAANEEAIAIAKTEAEIAKIREPLLIQQLALVNKSPNDSTKPLVETMSPQDIVAFTEIRSKLLFTSAQDYLESEHARDIEAIRTIWHIVMNRVDGKGYPSTDPKTESILSGLIRALDENLAKQPVTITVPDNSNSCDLPMALSIAESKLIETNNQQTKTVNSAIAWANSLTVKHKEMHGNMNFDQLTSVEKEQYKKVYITILKPAIDREQAVKDAEYLKSMYKLSAQRMNDGKQDLTKSGGDAKSVGATFKARPRDAATQMLVGALYYLGDEIPSQSTVMNQQIIKQVPQANKP